MRPSRYDDETGTASTPRHDAPERETDTWLQRHGLLLAAIALAMLMLAVFAQGVRHP